ncbi:gliding motility-associated-like protein [Flavobacterium sp. 28YEA47A]|uniref:HYR-like domain-containing protein n=1 Tax=Flavobacterium sp. 28YEA47A TaxID=3156276 RepID=UPI0035122982
MKNFTLREEIKVPQTFIIEKKNGRLKKRVRLNNKTVLSKLLLLSFLVLTALPSFAQQKELPARATKPNLPYAPVVKANKGGLEYQTMAVAGSISVAENATYNAYTAEQLVKNLFVTGCLSASNVRFGYYSKSGNNYTWQNHTWSSTPGNRQLAYFNKATSTFPIEEGLLLTTGKASSAMGPNNTGGSTDEMVKAANDPDLASITGRTIYDAATLEFDFVPAGNTLEFKYVFSSEEYLEYCETGYNDAFGFFLSGPGISGPYRNNAINLAVLPNTTTPISINTIHSAGTNVNGNNFPAVNGQYYQNNAAGSTTTQFDGNTVILTATYPVTPCSTYRIKLSIGDASDQKWDSGVFLGARSFNSENIVLTNYGNMIENQNNIFEGCNNKFRVQRTGSDISQPLVVNLLLSGTFTNGVDIQTAGGQPFPTQVTIPANQTYIDIPYTSVADGVPDNAETFIVKTITSCPCSSDVVYVTQTMTIYETAVLNSINATNAQCNGQNNGTLTVNVSGGSGSYLYSIDNGTNWQSINTFSNLSPGNYTVVVKDPGSCKPNISGTATIGNPTPIVANAGPDVTICPGGNTQLSGSGGVIYSWSPSTGLNFSNIANPIASPTTTTTYTLTVTNASGQCTSTDQVVVNVDASPVAPTAASVNNNNICSNVGGNIILSATGGSGTNLKWYTSSCGGTAIGTGNNLSIAAPTQTTTYYVRWESSCGNSTCAQVTVNVKPTVTLTGPTNASIQGCNQSSITPLTYSETPVSITLAQFQNAGGTTSNASLAHTITYKDTKAGSCPTVVTRVFTVATDCTTANFTQTITINDTTAPTFTGTLPAASITASCGNIPAAATLTATDACGSATVTFAETRTNGSCVGNYTLTRKWTATDLCGNTAEHTQIVTVSDAQSPVFAGTLPAANITATCGNIPAAATLTATDACGSATVTFAETRTNGSCAGNYTLTRKWTATDLCGNTAEYTQTVTVTDTQAPVFAGTLPAASITASCGNIPAAATLTATDACGSATVTFAETRTNGSCVGNYTLIRKWTATDLCGNTAEHTQIVTVSDAQSPVFAGTLPAANITATCGNIPAAATLTATDACGSATVTFAETRTNGSCAGNYTLTRKWTATDLCGNTAEYTQTVTVTDTQAPVFAGTLPAASITASCGNIPAAATLTATDACGSATVTFAETRTNGSCAGNYTLTRKWTATDLCGNTAVHTQVVTVTDTQAPVFAGTPPADVAVSCGNIPAAATLTATDACGTATVTFAETRTDGACAGSYTLTRKWTATDLCGNTAVHTQVVTVTDTQAPTFVGTLPSDVAISCGNIPAAATLTATDACGSATVTFAETRTNGSCAGNYTLTRKWTATDLCGNTAVHTQVVTVTDTQAPTFVGTPPADVAISCGNIPAAATLTATDACGSATVTFAETRTNGACAGSYTLTRKWTATDLCGNTAEYTQTVTVTDTQAPVFAGTLPAASITAACGNIPAAATLTATDACGSATVTFAETRTNGSCAGNYTLTRKWTATDLCGNTAEYTQTVTVTDTQAPVFAGTLPAASITASCGNIPAAATLTATDACGSATVTFAETRTNGACAGSYTLTRKWTATDLCGNTAEHTQIVTVTDTQAPVFAGTLPAASITASCGNIPAAATLTATDACGSATVTFAETRTNGACAGSYTLTRKWTATDLCGNTAVHTQVVTVTDTQAPTFVGTLPAAEVAAACDNIPAAATLTATDACGTATVTFAETRTDGACAGSYTLTRKWTATDLCGNTAEHTQVVTVTDTQAPAFDGTLPAAEVAAACDNIPAAATLTATDACGTATVTFAETRTDGACAGSYTLTRKWTATDLCGNTAEHTQVVNVTDTQAPAFDGTLPAAEVAASCDNIPAAATLTATDACGTATVTFAETRTDGACAGSYTLTRKWTATDLCGNTAEHTQVVTVTDTQAPAFDGTLPAAEVAAACDNIPAAATLTATDACGTATVTFAETRTDGACAGSYTLTRKWTATDLCGNTAEHTQVVNVTDTQAPTFTGTLPAAEVAAACDNIPAAATLTATDACGTATVTFAETRTDGACAGSYTLTRKWTATDLCGNTAEHTQVVTVTDTQAPVFAGTLPAAEVAAACDNIPAAATLTATDACGTATVTFAETRTDGACAGSYTLTRKWTATDLCGNTAEHTQVVTVTDTQAPAFDGTLPAAEVAAACDNIPAAATLTATDACGTATVTFAETRTDGACAGSYTLTRKWTATDLCGNTAEHTQVVNVTDTQAPVFVGTLPAASINASCDNIPAAATLTATDACGTATVTFAETRTDGACAGSYTLTRKWTATDLCGNTAEHTQVVTVTDIQAPAFDGTLPAAELAASCDNIPAAATLTATDACGTATVTFAETRTDGACAGSYTLTRKWTATDLCGNTAEHTQVVTVTDTQAPVFAGTLPAAEVAASCDNIPAAATLTATDACGSATVTFAETRTDGACAGSYTLTRKWTATDLCGNTAEHTQVVNVTDTQAPVFAGTLPAAEVAASCDNIPAAATLTATDACGSATVTFAETRTDGACAGSYTLTRKWTATDLCGNTAEHTQVVNVTDTQAPVFVGTLPAASINASCDNIPAAATLTATDACGTATVTFAETRTDGACAGSYTLTRKWTATDLCGNTAEHTQVVTVTDIQAPAFDGTLPAAELAASCDNIPAAATLTATDACGSATVTFAETRTDGACAGSYTLTRKWTATDLCGNTAEHTQVVNVTDTQAPVFAGTLPAAEVAASCDNIPAAATLTATDACGTATVTFAETRTDGACAGSYTLTRKWTATDLCGNTAEHTQVVTITDTQAPAFDGTLPAAELAASCDNIPAAATLTATDACGTATVTFAETRTDGACAGSYTLTRKWTAADLCGNTAEHTQVVTVTDIQAPAFDGTLPAAELAAACDNIPAAATLTATDACGTATVTFAETRTDGACAGSYTLTRKWTAADLCGNTAEHTQVVNVTDTQAPAFDGTLPAAELAASCDNIPAAATLTATDACGTATVTFAETRTDGACAGSYTLTRKWTATDLCGNTAEHTQVVNVTDTQAPAFDGTLPAVELAASCDNIPAAATLTATDACGTATVTFAETRTDGACAGSYTLTRKWTATDLCGNTAEHTQVVNVTDTQAPAFDGTLPAPELAASCDNIPAAATLTATDACGTATVTFAETRTDGACAGSYTLTRKWTATDLCGNTAEHTQVVNVTDTQAPAFDGTLPAVELAASCDNIPAAATLTATDACGTATVTFAETRTDGACAGSYTLTRKWTATDLCGNTAEHTQVVNVTDTQAPAFDGTLPAAEVAASCDNIPAAATLTATDACGTATVTFAETRTDGACAGSYTLTRKWTATDLCGNTAEHTQIVTVTDTQAPTFVETVPADVTVACGAIPAAVTLTATDNCSLATVTMLETIENGACAGDKIITRTWTAVDLCNNIASVTQVITVEDNTAPTLITPLQTTINVVCSEVPEAPALEFTDSCSSVENVIFDEQIENQTATGYTITRSWSATDSCGNSNVVTQTINVTIANPTQTINSELCIRDLSIDLFTLLNNSIERTGTWIDTNNSQGLLGSIFSPTNVPLGNYILSYVIADGDCPRTIQVNMNVNDDCIVLAPCEIIVHNAITPNGDGLNEFFKIEGLDCYPNNTVEIYNRWGVLVFDAQGYDNNTKVFRGVSEGRATVKKSEELPDGTYYYVLKYVDAEGKTREKASYLYINR